MAIPMNTQVSVLLLSGEIVEGEVAQVDQATYLCLRQQKETLYVPWTAIKCVKGPALPERGLPGALR
ncbi:MAG: hypothetical protein U0105_25725 [Candidatus Obscuribacterales bacterium]